MRRGDGRGERLLLGPARAAQLPDGTRGYLCSECVKRLRAKGYYEGLSDERGVEGSVITLAQGWF
jgi:hypothetical protein